MLTNRSPKPVMFYLKTTKNSGSLCLCSLSRCWSAEQMSTSKSCCAAYPGCIGNQVNFIKFNETLCSLSQMHELTGRLYKTSRAVVQAQYNSPVEDVKGVTGNRVRVGCNHLSNASLTGSDLLTAMVDALTVFDNSASVAGGCLTFSGAYPENTPPAEGPGIAPAEEESPEEAPPAPEAAPEAEAEPISITSQGEKWDYYVSVHVKYVCGCYL